MTQKARGGYWGRGERLTRTKAISRIWSCMSQRVGWIKCEAENVAVGQEQNVVHLLSIYVGVFGWKCESQFGTVDSAICGCVSL